MTIRHLEWPTVTGTGARSDGGTSDEVMREVARRRAAILTDADHGTLIAMAASVVVAAFVFEQDEQGTIVWLSIRLVASLVMFVLIRWVRRTYAADPHGAIDRYTLIAGLGSTVWGLLPVFVRPSEPQWQAIVVFALVGSLGVVATGYSSEARVFVAGSAPMIVIALVAIATYDGAYATVLCLALVLTAVYSVVLFRESNVRLTDMFVADIRNEQLLSQLEQHRTDLREINDRLHGMVDRQSMTLEERDALIAAVSHDLRSPLAAMSLMADTLAQRGSMMTDEQRQTILQRIAGDARHAAEVLGDLASTQRLGVQDVLATRSEVDVVRLVEQSVAAQVTEQHQVRVGAVDVGGAPVVADPVLVRRILDNLIGNARKHTPPGSNIEVGALRRDDQVLLHVDDDGPGLPEGLRDSVFDAYVRGTSATTRPGSGIGLFLVRTFAQLHGGEAWWEPSPIGGSRFVVSLPQ